MKTLTLIAATALALVAVPGLAAAKPKIVVTLERADDTFTLTLKQSIEAAAAQHPELDVVIEDAKRDSATQVGHVKDAIAQKADAIIIMNVDDAAATAAAADTAKAGIPLIFINRLPAIDRFDGQVSIVACNDLVAGRLQMRLVGSQINNTGNVVILRGEDGHPAARDRTAGVKEIIAAKPGLKLVHNETGGWKRANAEQLVAGWLAAGEHIDAIVANNDDMALGAIDALQKAGYKPGQVVVAGVDGTPGALDAIRSKWMTMSVLQNAKAQAQVAFEDAVKFVKKDYAQLYDWVPYEVIIPSNVETFASR
ncbi:MAG: substrate-binding domain-containing protein [Asticcacaulis sp.]|nr:substrate-binding domain-containing protein [Asticcacaulis sp.]